MPRRNQSFERPFRRLDYSVIKTRLSVALKKEKREEI